jgi:hypothetical protein
VRGVASGLPRNSPPTIRLALARRVDRPLLAFRLLSGARFWPRLFREGRKTIRPFAEFGGARRLFAAFEFRALGPLPALEFRSLGP